MNREELIFKYIENLCTQEERIQVEQLMQEDKEFREEIEQQITMNAMLNEEILLEPSHSFANQVMGKLADNKFFLSNFMFYLLGLVIVQAVYFSLQSFDFFPANYGINSMYLVYGMMATFFLFCIESANMYFAAK